MFSVPAKAAGPLMPRGEAECKIYGRPKFTETGWMKNANGSFVISERNNCKGRWSHVSGLFNLSYLLGIINTLITAATHSRANLSTLKVIIKRSKCQPNGSEHIAEGILVDRYF